MEQASFVQSPILPLQHIGAKRALLKRTCVTRKTGRISMRADGLGKKSVGSIVALLSCSMLAWNPMKVEYLDDTSSSSSFVQLLDGQNANHSGTSRKLIERKGVYVASSPAQDVASDASERKTETRSTAALKSPGAGHESLGDRLAKALLKRGVSNEAVIFFVSAMPIVELRAGIPIGFVLGVPPLVVFSLAVAGNLASVILVLLFLQFRFVQKVSRRFLERARKKALSIGNSQSRAVALALFVGVPLPGTGGWTGSTVAFVLGMPLRQSILSISAGVFMAALIVTLLCWLGKLGGVLGLLALCCGGAFLLYRSKRTST